LPQNAGAVVGAAGGMFCSFSRLEPLRLPGLATCLVCDEMKNSFGINELRSHWSANPVSDEMAAPHQHFHHNDASPLILVNQAAKNAHSASILASPIF
jgi:hypothetical protein